MADTDIIARLRLSSKAFTSEFNSALDVVDKKSKTVGEQFSASFGGSIGGSLRNATAQVPVFGSALAGLTGPAALAGAGIGAVAAAAVYGIAQAEDYAKATRQLGAVLDATGNKTGYSKDQLLAYAESMESALAIPAEEIIKAEQVLSSFDGVAGSTFKGATMAAANMAATFGGDLAGNTEKLGVVLQNLATGNVEGLKKGFKFLGTEVLANIEAMAKAGKGYEAQQALLAALEKRIGGTAAAGAGGVSGAFFRLKDAFGDTAKAFANETGLYEGTVNLFNRLADAASNAADYIRGLGAGVLAPVGADGSFVFANDPVNVTKKAEDQAARDAAETAKRNAHSAADADAAKAKADAEKKAADMAATKMAAEKKHRAELLKSLDDELAAMKTKAEQVGMAKDDLEFEKKVYGDLAKYSAVMTADRRSQAISSAQISLRGAELAASMKEAAGGTAELDALVKKGAEDLKGIGDAVTKAGDDMKRSAVETYRYLSDSFYTIFSGRSGDIWGKFKEMGARTLAELAAQFVLTGKINIGGTSAGGLLSSVASAVGGGSGGGTLGLASSAAGLAGGGAGIAGLIGTAGSPIAAGTGLLGSMGAAGTVLAAAAPWLAAAAGVAALGFALFGNKNNNWSDQTLSTGADGTIVASGSRAKGADAKDIPTLFNAVQSGLAGIASSVGGKIAEGVKLGSIGSNKDKFYFDPTGANTFDAPTAQKFDTAEGAAAALIQNALAQGAVTGLGDTVTKILAGSGDLQSKIAKATQFQTALAGFDKQIDPAAAAIKDLGTQFSALRDMMIEAGASADEMAKASAAYDKQLAALQTSTRAGGTAIADFLTSLKIGSSSPLSLADQQAAAKSAYDAASASIGTSGFDASALVSAGRSYLDVQRNIDGGTAGFFDVFNRVLGDTQRAASGGNVATLAGENPFAAKTADATASTAASAAQLLDATLTTNALLSRLVNASGGGGGAFSGDLGYLRSVA